MKKMKYHNEKQRKMKEKIIMEAEEE
jgi:hypothetical protein